MKILFTPYGGGSMAHIVRSLAVADELKARGHEILFTSPNTKTLMIRRAGYEVFGAGHPEVNLNDEHDQSVGYFRTHRADFLAWLADELAAAESFRPDIIVNSPSFFGPLARLKLGIPYVSIINAGWLVEFRGLLGLSKSGRRPAHSAARTLLRPLFIRGFERVYMDEIRSFYAELGVSPLPGRRRDLHRHNPALIPSVPKFEPIYATQRQDLHYVGPLFWQGFEQERLQPEKLFSHWGEKPFVYVSLGGSIYRKRSYDELIEALAARKGWNILLSIGPNFPRQAFPADTSHLVIRPYVPGLQACQHADVVVSTASHGTVMQALWYGKPLVTLPHNIDQATIAERLAELGAGVNLNRASLTDFANRSGYFSKATRVPWQRILDRTRHVLESERFKLQAQGMQRSLRRYPDGGARAADIIEKYASLTDA